MPKQMKVFYDTEFHEDGHTIDLISIGMVRSDGKEFYAVSNEFDTARVQDHEWLMENVMSSINYRVDDYFGNMIVTDPAAMSREQIKNGILDFTADIWPEFWAWYGAYDHIALCQLFGRMIDLPKQFPMFTMDIRQLYKDLGQPGLPVQPEGKHNALADAKHNQTMWRYLMEEKDRQRDKRDKIVFGRTANDPL